MGIDPRQLMEFFEYACFDSIPFLGKIVKKAYNPENTNVIIKMITPVYTEEHSDLYKLISVLISLRGSVQHPLKQQVADFLEKKVTGPTLLANLWRDYVELDTQTVSKYLESNPAQFYLTKMSKQFWILLSIFKGVCDDLFVIDSRLFSQMFNLFAKQRFMGSFLNDLKNVDGNTALDPEFQDTADNIVYLSVLILIEALKISNSIRYPPDVVLSSENKAFQIVSDCSSEVLKECHRINNEDEELSRKIDHFTAALVTSIDTYDNLIDRYKPQELKPIRDKLNQVLENFDYGPEYMDAITNLLDSKLMSFLTESEISLVKSSLKSILTLVVLPKKPNRNIINQLEEHNIEFLASFMSRIIESPTELNDFWRGFDHNQTSQSNISVVFSNFLDVFPHRGIQTLKIATHLVGKSNISYAQEVIDIFSRLNYYTIPGSNEFLSSIEYRDVDTRDHMDAGRGEQQQYWEITRACAPECLYGLELPAGTIIRSCNDENIRICIRYNFWNIFWRMITGVLNEKQAMKDISLTLFQQKMIKLICRIIYQEPYVASYLQMMMLTPSNQYEALDDMRNYDFGSSGYSALAMMLLEILNMLRTNPNNINLVLEITRAINKLLGSDCAGDMILVIQISEQIGMMDGDNRGHLLSSLIDIFKTKIYSQEKKPALLLQELVKLTEFCLLKSDYLYDYFPSEALCQSKSRLKRSEDDNSMRRILSQYSSLLNSSLWEESNARAFNDEVIQMRNNLKPGSLLISTNLLLELLHSTVTQAVDIICNRTIIEFDNCTDLQLSIHARLFSIFTNLLERFSRNQGDKISNQRIGPNESISLDDITEFFKKINLPRILFAVLEPEIYIPDVFYGKEKASSRYNELGIENKYFIDKIALGQNRAINCEFYQTFIIEAMRCLDTVIDLIGEYIRDSSCPAGKLLLVREMTNSVTLVDSFYTYPYNNFVEEYEISFPILLLILANFNREKEVKSFETRVLHNYSSAYSAFANKNLFSNIEFSNPTKIFTDDINQCLTLGSGRTGQIKRQTSVTSAAFNTLTNLLALWRKTNRAVKPVFADILTTGKMTSHFSYEILPWTHQIILDRMADCVMNPQQATNAMKFLCECLQSQSTYISEFLKYCNTLRDTGPKINELVHVIQKMIDELERLSLNCLFEKESYLECLCQLTELVSNLYLRPNIRRGIVTQLKPAVLGNLAKLIGKVSENRREFIGLVIQVATGLYINSDGGYLLAELPDQERTVNLIRIRYVFDQECHFCFAIGMFMKVLNAEILERGKESSSNSLGQDSTLDPRLFLQLMNYGLESRRLKLFPFAENLISTALKRLLNLDSIDNPLGQSYNYLSDNDPEIYFKETSKLTYNQFREGYYEQDWGWKYDEQDTLIKLKESSLGYPYLNSALFYISGANNIKRVLLFSQYFILQVNKNLSLLAGNGLNGLMFATTLHQNPAYAPYNFIKNLFGMININSIMLEDSRKNSEDILNGAASIKDTFSDSEMRLFNPLYQSKNEEWLGNLYGYSGKYADDLFNFKGLAEKILDEISDLAGLVGEARKEFSMQDLSTEPEGGIIELIGLICQASLSHLTCLGHLLTNGYYGLLENAEENNADLINLKEKMIRTVSTFLQALNSRMSYSNTQRASSGLEMQATYYSLFILGHFDRDVSHLMSPLFFVDTTNSLRQAIRSNPEMLPVSLQSYLQLIKFHPDAFESADLDILLKLLQDDRLNEDSYKSICQLLITAFDSPKLRPALTNLRTFGILCSLKRFLVKSSFINFVYYQGEQKDSEFGLWLWTLATIVHAFEAVRSIGGAHDNLLSFIRTYETRILSVLGFQFASLHGGFASFDDERIRGACFRSSAYTEELELTLTLLDMLFSECGRWVSQHKALYDNLVYVMLVRTTNLFETNFSITEQYVPVSWIDKLCSRVTVINSSNPEHKSEGFSRKASVHPKATNKKSAHLSETVRSRGMFFENQAGSYLPDLFSFGLEVRLLKCLFHLMSILSEALPHTDLVKGGAPGIYTNQGYNGNSAYPAANPMIGPGMLRHRYDEYFWKKIPEIFVRIQAYLLNSLGRFIYNEEAYRRGTTKLAMVANAGETAVQEQMTNCIFPPSTAPELHKMTFAGMEMSFYVFIILLQNFDNTDRNIKVLTTDQMKKARSDSAVHLSQFEQINRQKMTLHPVNSIHKNSVLSHMHASIRKTDEEEDERYFTMFMKKYFPKEN